jgi:hypothetical protein
MCDLVRLFATSEDAVKVADENKGENIGYTIIIIFM